MRPKPLAGVNVVELSTTVAGPAAGAMLSDYGATVVKIEPDAGDPFRDVLGAVGAARVRARVRVWTCVDPTSVRARCGPAFLR